MYDTTHLPASFNVFKIVLEFDLKIGLISSILMRDTDCRRQYLESSTPPGASYVCSFETTLSSSLLIITLQFSSYVSSSSLFDLDRNIALLFVGGGDKIDGRLDCFTAL